MFSQICKTNHFSTIAYFFGVSMEICFVEYEKRGTIAYFFGFYMEICLVEYVKWTTIAYFFGFHLHLSDEGRLAWALSTWRQVNIWARIFI